MVQKTIFLISPPFRGHLHPMLGIARRLDPLVNTVVLSTAEGIKAAAAAGLKGRAIMAGYEEEIRAISEPGHEIKNHPVRLYRQFKANVGLMATLKAELDRLYRAERPDLVIADFSLPVAGLAAIAQGIPWWTMMVSPSVLETLDGPPAYFGGQAPARTPVQSMKQAAMRRATRSFKYLMWGLFRGPLRALGFKGVYRPDGTEAAYSPECILGLGVPELEFPCTYPPHVRLLGPVLYTPPFDGPVPVFNNDGRPHVLVSLGTHVSHAKPGIAGVLQVIARRNPGIVFHFARGDVSSPVVRQADNLHEYPYVSYADHLPRYDLVVHHAGTGIMHYCLRHAKPAVVHPLDYDQFDNAARLVAAGVAVEARRLEDLEPAIFQALADPALHAKCDDMSRVYARYDAEGEIAEMVLDAL